MLGWYYDDGEELAHQDALTASDRSELNKLKPEVFSQVESRMHWPSEHHKGWSYSQLIEAMETVGHIDLAIRLRYLRHLEYIAWG